MTSAEFFLGKPQKFKDICTIYPPKVGEIVGNSEFNAWISAFEMTQEDLEDEFKDFKDENGNTLKAPTPFEYLMINCYHSEGFLSLIQKGFEFFLHEPVNFLFEANAILIGNLEEELERITDLSELKLLTQDNYFDFQNVIRTSIGHNEVDPPEDWSLLDPRIVRFKQKARERDKVKAKQEAKKAPNLETTLASICCMGIGLTPLNIGEISYASVSKIVETNQKHEKYDLDCRSLLMGADAKKINFEYWIRN